MNCPACDLVNAEGARYCAKCGALLPIAHEEGADPLIGKVVGGRFRITGLLGEGGMGRVYTAEQQMGTAIRKVAVKTLLQEFSKDPQVVARFMRECGTVVELEHPNTIKFHDFGQTDAGDLYIAMEFVDGRPLSDVLEKEGALSPERVVNIMKQVCGSLHEAHEKGVVHRDLKPDNIILTTRAGEKDFVKVLDFGIAKRAEAADEAKEQKLTQAGMVLGTPPYMSPEQFTGKKLDHRSDVYSLGVLAYEMLTGKLPFDAKTPWEWATQHMTQQPFPFEQTSKMAAHFPPAVKQSILRALSKEKEQRQASAREFYLELSGGQAPAGRTIVGSDTSAAAGSTQAFAPPTSGPARAGATQIGEPLFPPPGMQGPPGMPPQMQQPQQHAPQHHAPQHHVPTGGGQAVPAAPLPPRQQGGGKGGLIAGAALVAVLLIGGAVFAFKDRLGIGGGGDDEETTTPIATTEPSGDKDDDGEDAGANTGDADAGEASVDAGEPADAGELADAGEPADAAPLASVPTSTPTGPASTPPPPPPPPPPPEDASGSAACRAASSAAIARNCDEARSSLRRCSGFLRGEAEANVNRFCRRIPRPKKK